MERRPTGNMERSEMLIGIYYKNLKGKRAWEIRT
jgi:hypothetical protein